MAVGLRLVRPDAIFSRNDRRNGGIGNTSSHQMNADRTVLTDAMWARIEHILPGKTTDSGATAGTAGGFSRPFSGGPGRVRPGWRNLRVRFGKWNKVFKRFRRLALSGIFEHVFNELSDDLDLECVFVDGTIVQAHQKASGARGNSNQGLGRDRGPGIRCRPVAREVGESGTEAVTDSK